LTLINTNIYGIIIYTAMLVSGTGFYTYKECHKKRIPLKSYYYKAQGRRTIGRPKKSLAGAVVTVETGRVKGYNP
jgi:hypothetical protein